MKSRRLASIALVTAVLFGTTGCAMISNQATTIPYSPSDGVAANAGALEVRNALIVTEDGEDGNLVAAIVNTSADAQVLLIEFGEEGDLTSEEIRVPANGVVSLGTEDREPLLLEGIDSQPGTNLAVYFQSGDEPGELTLVPVLDGTLPYYADLVP